MALADITRDDVLAAITEFDAQGRGAFLESYGFSPTDEHLLVHEGRPYDVPALTAAAHGFARPEFGALTPLSMPHDLSAVTGHLHDLGFQVKSTHHAPRPNPQRQLDIKRWRSTYELVCETVKADPSAQTLLQQSENHRAERDEESLSLIHI